MYFYKIKCCFYTQNGDYVPRLYHNKLEHHNKQVKMCYTFGVENLRCHGVTSFCLYVSIKIIEIASQIRFLHDTSHT